MDVFTAAPHHDILVLVFRVAILLFTARALGEIAQRLGQPAVVGEILSGILLGPSVLSGIFPAVHQIIVPQTPLEGYLLEIFALIGVMFLMLMTGLETDLNLIRHNARTGMGVSLFGIILPFASGFILGQHIPDILLKDPSQRVVFSLFLATAMSITAIPVIAKVLIDMKLIRRDIGQTILAAGVFDDTIGWILLAVVAGLARGQTVTPGLFIEEIGVVLLFMVVTFTVGRWLAKKSLDIVQDELISPHRILSLVLFFALIWGGIAQALELEAVLGAFVIGIIFGQMPRLPNSVFRTIERVTLGIFAPIFFAVAGLKVNIKLLMDPQLFLVAVWVILIACFGKIVGGYLGAVLVGKRDHWTALSFGMGINARGAMEIIVATIGLSLGVLNQNMFTIIVLMAVVTSVIAPIALRWTLRHVKPEEQELRRLREEELVKGSPIAKIHRVLMPMRHRDTTPDMVQSMKAHILQKIGTSTKLSITLLSIVKPGEKTQSTEFLDKMAEFFSKNEITKKIVESDSSESVILEESRKNYDLLILGASEQRQFSENLFSSLIDSLIRMAPCTTMVIQENRKKINLSPKKILVPSNGSLASKRAAELAFMLGSSQEEILLLSVVTRDKSSGLHDLQGEVFNRQLGIAHQSLEELKELGLLRGVSTSADVHIGPSPETVILDRAIKEDVDLIILGTDVRPGSHLFLGPRVERILKNAPCPVIVLNSSET